MKKDILQRFEIVCLMVVLILITGCVTSSGNFANLSYDDQVKQTFESYIVLQEYNYFYTGPKTFPKAVIGISKEYTVESKLWNPIELTSEELRKWIYVQANRRDYHVKSYGSRIVGPNGEHIGIWYSLKSWEQWARVELIQDNVVKMGGVINQGYYGPPKYKNRFSISGRD